ncbi:hypothetical protein Sj15T_28860 [Sphingobium sp. TA15]|uniref:Uncharacterized protein n=1 Tax=Sphingobium indicum (strain DSM 16413 / CCM 7287 / MTCC 6362 / UT26 / NBRC 101211 / UT26S) TaxID=452662 RepID=D4YXA1_SPHIU|nr:hypothetical protein [Sphingobium indicum]BAI94983.1 hypothetical protein SJA_C1-01490 [Sphingobium indicum UT26S]BDD67865.1 hypothetical protein Sj15T_28860 [Sphingobium sp. TA15]
MNKLIADAIDAHGGWERWEALKSVQVDVVTGGELLDRKTAPGSGTLRITAKTQRQECRMGPIDGDMITILEPGRVAIETADGTLVAERHDPRAAFNGHELDTPWDPLHRTYFGCYAMWSYLTVPFSLAMPGVQVWDIDPLEEDGELWQGVRVVMPDEIATHSRAQEFYFGDDMLIRRQDYTLDIAGGHRIANYALDIVSVDGLKFASKRRAYMCNKKYEVLRDRLLIRLDLSNFQLIA